jgi:hypothetical protein
MAGYPVRAVTMVQAPKPGRMVPVIRRIQDIGISLKLLAPMVTAAAAMAHRPRVAPAKTGSGS